jgi:hypothetical protein
VNELLRNALAMVTQPPQPIRTHVGEQRIESVTDPVVTMCLEKRWAAWVDGVNSFSCNGLTSPSHFWTAPGEVGSGQRSA